MAWRETLEYHSVEEARTELGNALREIGLGRIARRVTTPISKKANVYGPVIN
jgi:hypothetical protein